MDSDHVTQTQLEDLTHHFQTHDLHNSNQPKLEVLSIIRKYDTSKLNNDKTDQKKNLQCMVCGARASGYNFDQITCESCKAFFRRNALKNLTGIQCRFAGVCDITVANRRHCVYCRIKKCFTVGMRKEWIRSEEEKSIKRVQSEQNRMNIHNRRPTQKLILRQPGGTNSLIILSSQERQRLNNITHCYDQYTGDPCILKYTAPKELLSLRLHEFYNRKKPIIISFISYLKHLPEFQQLNIDDQVLLIKENIRILLPLNYALLKTPIHSEFRYTSIRTIGCVNDINIHSIYQMLSDSFVPFVTFDPLLIKLLIIPLFFATNSQSMNTEIAQYKQLEYIKQTQSSYTELLWLYMTEKCGEEKAINLFSKIIAKFIFLQTIIAQIDSVIRLNQDVQHLDSLMQTVLQLT